VASSPLKISCLQPGSHHSDTILQDGTFNDFILAAKKIELPCYEFLVMRISSSEPSRQSIENQLSSCGSSSLLKNIPLFVQASVSYPERQAVSHGVCTPDSSGSFFCIVQQADYRSAGCMKTHREKNIVTIIRLYAPPLTNGECAGMAG